jgi:hypothetical protein
MEKINWWKEKRKGKSFWVKKNVGDDEEKKGLFLFILFFFIGGLDINNTNNNL